MSHELEAAIGRLQTGDDEDAQQAFGEIAQCVRRDAGSCATELSRAVLAEVAGGGLRTPRLLTLLGMTREPVPECVPLCLNLLRPEVNSNSQLTTDATLGAAAIVARVSPQALLPDLASVNDAEAAFDSDREVAKIFPLLLAISSRFLGELPNSGVTDMARWLWFDCAALDLMTVADLVGWYVQESGADDPLVELMVDLVERLPAGADEKNYAVRCLTDAGISEEAIEQLESASRAIRVAPAIQDRNEPSAVIPAQPPAPDPRADELLAMFGEGPEESVELARVAIDQIFEFRPSKALTWWLVVTVDALAPWRRSRDIDWALVQIVTALRRHGEEAISVPPSVLQRWLDTPQLLSLTGTKIALDLLSRKQPHLVVERYLHRAVAASSDRHAEILMKGLWRALVVSEPLAVLAVASRWLAFGFGQHSFLELLLDLLIERTRSDPALIDRLAESLASLTHMSEPALEVARNLLDLLREELEENSRE